MNLSRWWVFAFLVVYAAVAFGWRSWLQYRRTGSTGFRGTTGRAFSTEWWGGVLLVVGLLGTFFAPVAAPVGVETWAVPGALSRVASLSGGVALAAGLIGTVVAQMAMGASWRIGVDPAEHTALITHGPFRWVRNPIFTSMLLVAAGVALMVPNALSVLGFAVALLGLELQVRRVEEPYLLRAHPDYAAYAARVGRFVPGLGRLSQGPDTRAAGTGVGSPG